MKQQRREEVVTSAAANQGEEQRQLLSPLCWLNHINVTIDLLKSAKEPQNSDEQQSNKATKQNNLCLAPSVRNRTKTQSEKIY